MGSTGMMKLHFRFFRFAFLSIFAFAGVSVAQEKKEEKKPGTPKVMTAVPFSALRGKSNTLQLRGMNLAESASARLEGAGAPIAGVLKIKGKLDAARNADPAKVGDSRMEVGFEIPAGVPAAELSLIVTSPGGETKPFKVLLLDPALVVEEKEPNGGFREAQEIKVGQIVRGAIQEPGDVDVFKFLGKAGENVTAEVDASRHGSPLDSLLMLYDAGGHELARNDDGAGGLDSALQFKLPKEGVYYLCISDANGSGSSAHAYVLSVGTGTSSTKPAKP
jgi:hypothetical protein